MKTENLISALAADLPTKTTSVQRAVAIALALSVPVMLALLLGFVKIRPGLAGMLTEPKIILKFVFTLGLHASALWLALRISRPGVGAGPAKFALAATFAVLAVAVAIELIQRPAETWASVMIGHYAVPCVTLIVLFSIAPFAAIMVAMRNGAPDNPTLAGAVGGLVAGSIAAAVYATHCVEDSALFIAVWYLIGISAATLAGAVVGRFALRW